MQFMLKCLFCLQGVENTRKHEEQGRVVMVTEHRVLDGGNRKGHIVIRVSILTSHTQGSCENHNQSFFFSCIFFLVLYFLVCNMRNFE